MTIPAFRWRRALLGAGLALTLACAREPGRTVHPRELWLYYATDLADSSNVTRLEGVWTRAAAAGYSRVILADSKFSRLAEMDSAYFGRVRRVRELAARLGLEIIPGVFPMGRSNGVLARDPNLVEALPVRDALFEVHHGEARLRADPPVRFAARPDVVDGEVQLERGIARIRDPRRRARLMYRVAVAPFRCYQISVWARTQDFTGTPMVRVLAAGKPLHFARKLGVRSTQDWTLHTLAFHSLDHSEVAIYLGSFGPARGELDWSRWSIDETGPFNVVRRVGTPFETPGLVEGRDYEPVVDPGLGTRPWRGQYDEWHEPIAIHTRLPEGTRFRASWYQAAVLFGGQVTCCLSDSALLPRLADEAARVRTAWGAKSFMMMHDEIRALNWDRSCTSRGLTPGRILADHARACAALLRGSRVFVWSDMFDPHHDAVDDGYYVNGNLAGSWEGLPPEVGIVNWNAAHARESLRFFARRGHAQVLAGYYDGRPEDVRRWIAAAAGVDRVTAIMYTTWQGRFDDLEAFAREVRAAGS